MELICWEISRVDVKYERSKKSSSSFNITALYVFLSIMSTTTVTFVRIWAQLRQAGIENFDNRNLRPPPAMINIYIAVTNSYYKRDRFYAPIHFSSVIEAENLKRNIRSGIIIC